MQLMGIYLEYNYVLHKTAIIIIDSYYEGQDTIGAIG